MAKYKSKNEVETFTTKEMMQLVDVVSREKDIPIDSLKDFIEMGIETAVRKNFPEGSDIRVQFEDGDIKGYRCFELVNQIENFESQMLFNEVEDEIIEDGFAYEPFAVELTRQQLNIVKQVVLQKIKEYTRQEQIQQLLDKKSNVHFGVVKAVKAEGILLDVNGLDLNLPSRELVGGDRGNGFHRERFKVNDKIYFSLIKDGNRYIASRRSEEFLKGLLTDEVRSIADGDIEIVSIVRNAGFQAKVIVKGVNKADPVRWVVGSKGAHIKAVQSILGQERIDVIEYNPNVAELLLKVIHPVAVTRILLDEDNLSIEFAVAAEDQGRVCGREGRQLRMLSQLMGYNLVCLNAEQWEEKEAVEKLALTEYFVMGLACDEEVASVLIDNGFSNLEEVAYVSKDEMSEYFDEELIIGLKDNALQTLKNAKTLEVVNSVKNFYSVGLTKENIQKLYDHEVFTFSDLADLSTDELQEFITLDQSVAQSMIVKARTELKMI